MFELKDILAAARTVVYFDIEGNENDHDAAALDNEDEHDQVWLGEKADRLRVAHF
ncbi:hypothetical protein V8F06_002484 [Rhypophila decipiens]